MRPAYLAIAVALAVSIVVVLFGPTLVYWANGQNIVGDRSSAASYAVAAVGLLGVALAASAAFITYEIQKRDQRDLKHRTCAILVKMAIRPALEDMLETFILGLDILTQEQRAQYLGERMSTEFVVPNGKEEDVRQFYDRYRKTRTSLSLDAQTADALAHLDRSHVAQFLKAHATLERIKADLFDRPDEEEFAFSFLWVERTLNCLLILNAALGAIIWDDYGDKDAPTSTTFWITRDDVVVPF